MSQLLKQSKVELPTGQPRSTVQSLNTGQPQYQIQPIQPPVTRMSQPQVPIIPQLPKIAPTSQPQSPYVSQSLPFASGPCVLQKSPLTLILQGANVPQNTLVSNQITPTDAATTEPLAANLSTTASTVTDPFTSTDFFIPYNTDTVTWSHH